jgi:hypothetical protein
VLADPSPEIDSFNRKACSLILFEVGFCRDLGYHKKIKEKTDKYNPLVTTLRRYWGMVDLVCILIGQAGTTLNDTATDIATALAQVRPLHRRHEETKGTQDAGDKQNRSPTRHARARRKPCSTSFASSPKQDS